MNINYPFYIDSKGRVAGASNEQHLHQLIEQVLFITPGERVNRPDFGSGTKQLVFAPNSKEVAAAYQFLVQGALQQWLGDIIRVINVQIESDEMVMNITISYVVLKTKQSRTATFTNAVGAGLFA